VNDTVSGAAPDNVEALAHNGFAGALDGPISAAISKGQSARRTD
jgi:hypothetical protein